MLMDWISESIEILFNTFFPSSDQELYRKYPNLVHTKRWLVSRVRTIIRMKKIINRKSVHYIRVHQNYFDRQVRTNS